MAYQLSLTEWLTSSSDLLKRSATPEMTMATSKAISALTEATTQGKPILVCGNGGSASDALHIAGELVGRYRRERRAINCLCLAANAAAVTALGNDYSYEVVFARQVEAHGAPGGVLWGLSTSGNSPNMVAAFTTARSIGMTTLALTGEGGGKLAALADILIAVRARDTPAIQQVHICIYHYICEMIELSL